MLITGVAGGSANNFFVTYSRVLRLIGGGAYLSKNSILTVKIMPPFPLDNIIFYNTFLTCCAKF